MTNTSVSQNASVAREIADGSVVELSRRYVAITLPDARDQETGEALNGVAFTYDADILYAMLNRLPDFCDFRGVGGAFGTYHVGFDRDPDVENAELVRQVAAVAEKAPKRGEAFAVRFANGRSLVGPVGEFVDDRDIALQVLDEDGRILHSLDLDSFEAEDEIQPYLQILSSLGVTREWLQADSGAKIRLSESADVGIEVNSRIDSVNDGEPSTWWTSVEDFPGAPRVTARSLLLRLADLDVHQQYDLVWRRVR